MMDKTPVVGVEIVSFVHQGALYNYLSDQTISFLEFIKAVFEFCNHQNVHIIYFFGMFNNDLKIKVKFMEGKF